MWLHRVVVAVLLVCAMLGAAPHDARVAEPTLTLTPNQGPCGMTVAARGAGFPAGATVEITVATDYKAQPADPFASPEAAASAVFTVGPVAQRPLPTLPLTPDAGACNTPIVASGANWFPGDVLGLTAFPLGSHQGVGFATITVGPEGTVSLPIEVHRATLCSAQYAPPLGAQYRISAGPAPKQNSPRQDFATATYTIAQERLTERCFAETGQCVRGVFFDRWERHGLAGNGYPLTGEIRQTLEDGNEYTVQYFERVRLELHPENDPPHDILIGQFGRRILAGVPGAPIASAEPRAGYTFVVETGHNVSPRFMEYWQFNGGLEQFGFPLTEEFEQQLENGNVYRVQYFERARFEHHPENAPPYDVLLGQFGRQIFAEELR